MLSTVYRSEMLIRKLASGFQHVRIRNFAVAMFVLAIATVAALAQTGADPEPQGVVQVILAYLGLA